MAHSSSPSRCKPSAEICRRWIFIGKMTNDESRMTKEVPMTDDKRHGQVLSWFRASSFVLRHFFLKRPGYARRDESGHVAAEARDFLNDPRTEISVFLFRHQENCLDLPVELPVHQRHLEFKFKIGDGAEAADDGGGFPGDGKIDEQTIELREPDVFQSPDGGLKQI